MTTNIQKFFKKNKKGAETVKFTLPNFGDAEFEIKVLTAEESEQIDERAFVNKVGRKGKQEKVFSVAKHNREMCVASLIVPDLNSKELQESYGCMGATELFGKMFNWGEQALILDEIQQAAGLVDINKDVEEAKN